MAGGGGRWAAVDAGSERLPENTPEKKHGGCKSQALDTMFRWMKIRVFISYQLTPLQSRVNILTT